MSLIVNVLKEYRVNILKIRFPDLNVIWLEHSYRVQA